MANELFSAFFPPELVSTSSGKPSGGLGDGLANVAVGYGRGLGFNTGVDGATVVFARVPNAVALATGLTAELLLADDTLNPSAGKVAVFGVTIGPITSGTSTLDGNASTGALASSTEVTANVTMPSTSGVAKTQSIAVANANLNSLAAGNWAMIRIRRIGTNASDTHKGTVVLLGVDLRNT